MRENYTLHNSAIFVAICSVPLSVLLWEEDLIYVTELHNVQFGNFSVTRKKVRCSIDASKMHYSSFGEIR